MISTVEMLLMSMKYFLFIYLLFFSEKKKVCVWMLFQPVCA